MFSRLVMWYTGTDDLRTPNHALDAEPPVASFLKLILNGGGPVNATVLPTKTKTSHKSRILK